MAKYATGKYAKAISDRSGMEFPYKEMVREWNGAFVHVSEFEPKQPQLEPKPMNGDAISLRHVRTARTENDVPYSIPENGLLPNIAATAGSFLPGLTCLSDIASPFIGFGSNCGCFGSNSDT